jgi:TRAP-type C4-dicarboxylate transport system permease small subunit
MAIRFLETLLRAFVAVIFLFFVSITFAQVVLRYGFASSIAWFDEMSRYAFIWLVFLAAAAMARHGAHIAIDLVEELAGPRLRKGLLVLADLALVAFAAIVGIGGWNLMQVNWTTTAPASGIPIAWIQAVLPAFGVLMTVFAIAHLLDVLKDRAGDPNS